MLPMDLRKSVEIATLLPSTSKQSKFYRLNGLSQAAKDRKMNQRIVKTPQNILLLEGNDNNVNNDDDHIDDNNILKQYTYDKQYTFNNHTISAAIKEVNGGCNLSNRHWEETWRKNLEDITKVEKSSTHDSSKVDFRSKFKNKSSKNASEQKNQKIFKNAAIMGLVNTNKILIQDILYPNKEDSIEETSIENLDKAASTDTIINTNIVEYVPHCEDPEIFVHPVQMGLDITKFPDLDFTVPHIGQKVKETPQQYFLRTTNDDSFRFVKKNKDNT